MAISDAERWAGLVNEWCVPAKYDEPYPRERTLHPAYYDIVRGNRMFPDGSITRGRPGKPLGVYRSRADFLRGLDRQTASSRSRRCVRWHPPQPPSPSPADDGIDTCKHYWTGWQVFGSGGARILYHPCHFCGIGKRDA
jgi:hypothetical protein